MEAEKIQIIEKPDWVSWDDIKQCLYEAHASNRDKGIYMAHYQWPVEKMVEAIGENGKMFVALDGKKLMGVAAVCEKTGNSWYAKGKYAYMGFAGVLPECKGRGVYNEMIKVREEFVKCHSYKVMVFDTHQNNKLVQKVALKNGYRYVSFFQAASKDHYCVIMAKWLDGCPYSKFYCETKYLVGKMKTLLITKILHR